MTNIIDLRAELSKRNGPDQEFVYIDCEGTSWLKFTCSFIDGGCTFSFPIWAVSIEDAERRLDELKATAKVEGQVLSEIPA